MELTQQRTESRAGLPRASLLSDDRGGILIVGIFATAFLVGILYMVIGVGTAVQHGQQMHDAADSGAFMFAQMHATAMNLIALLNMVKLSTLAVIVAPAALVLGTKSTIAWISSNLATLYAFGWAIPLLTALGMTASLVYNQAVARAYPVEIIADRAQYLLKNTLPVVAQLETSSQLEDFYRPPVNKMISLPLTPLPISFESRPATCARAFPLAFSIISKGTNMFVPPSPPNSMNLLFSSAAYPSICLSYARGGANPENGSEPGGEDFQVRTFVLGDKLSDLGERGIGVATWGETDRDSSSAAIDTLSKISFAQAEYYYDGRVSRLNALWSMNWRARLRRFTMGGNASWPFVH